MRMMQKAAGLIMMLALVLLIGSPVFAGTAVEKIVVAEGDQQQPALGEKHLVWQEKSSRDGYGIAFMKSTGGKINRIPSTGGIDANPDVYGDYIVWDSSRYSADDVFLYDINQGTTTRITWASSEQKNPSIWGNWVVWQDRRNGDWDLYAYNIETKEERCLVNHEGDQINPVVHRNLVVYQDNRNDNWDIYVYELDKSKEKVIARAERDQVTPDIYENTIVWADDRNLNWDIYSFDLRTGREKALVTYAKDQVQPKIFEQVVVWTDYRGDNADLYYYNLADRAERVVFSGKYNQTQPAIWGKKVVWVDDGEKNMDLYGTSIEIYSSPSGTEEQGIKVVINGERLDFDQPPVMKNCRVLVPFRKIAESLGAEVKWDSDTRTVTVTKGERFVSLSIGATWARVKDGTVKLDVPAEIIRGRTLVPVRLVAEALNTKVSWEQATNTVILKAQ